MKKVLVVATENYFQEALGVALRTLEEKIKIITSSHEKAMETFLLEEPLVVIVCDYYEYEELKNSPVLPGEQTFNDLKMSATDEKIFRCGLNSYEHADYIKIPCKIDNFKKILK
jgi:hypothetical protein